MPDPYAYPRRVSIIGAYHLAKRVHELLSPVPAGECMTPDSPPVFDKGTRTRTDDSMSSSD